MNPQDQNGGFPPDLNQPAPQPVSGHPQQPPVINIPGQEPYVAAPIQPQPTTQQPAIEHSPYEFILNPQKPAKPIAPLVPTSLPKRILLFAGVALVLIILFSVISSLLKSSPSTAPLLAVLQEQTEIIRIATAGETAATTEPTKSLAYAVQLSVTSQNVQLNRYLSTNKIKMNQQLLAAKRSTTDDKQLMAAQQNGTYDQSLTGVIQKDLGDYQQALHAAYVAKPGPKGERLLSSQYDAAQLLLQQTKQ